MLDFDKNPFPSTSIAMTEDGQNMPKSLQSSARKSFPSPVRPPRATPILRIIPSFPSSPLLPPLFHRTAPKKKTTWGKIKITAQK